MLNTVKHLLQTADNWWRDFIANMDKHRDVVVENVIKVLACGTTVMGHSKYCCSNSECSHTKVVPYTCKSRFCSACGKKATEIWIEEQNAVLPQCEYQHITFTIPKEFRIFFLYNRWLLNEFVKKAAETLLKTAKDKGITIGIFAAIHTFGRDLKWNVHVHISVTRGGLSKDGENWESIYFANKVIMPMWRFRVIYLLREAYNHEDFIMPDECRDQFPDYASYNRLLNNEYQKYWFVNFSPADENHHHNVSYLGRYLKRPALANSRLRHYDGRSVIFNYYDHKEKKHKNYECSVEEFIERLTQHIPEKFFKMIRYYGFLANRVRKTLLPKVYDLLDQTIEAAQSVTYSSLMKANYAVDPLICILCGNEMRLSGFTNSTPLWQLRQHHEKLAKMKQVRL
ncbi:Putative transposase (plasmid) [Piscirickettsia salmonis]|uniref:IS91 family transposase n=2 Tax=Piscirickettsia salmonis TaxID=1238 RepID=UPI00205B30D1|nr:IS91 family transposase [Piscirickettsia salmonis]QGP50540.1 Putative transposase [Piscirickettsia salmonis]QGP51414.1 Putative transposase [Piscirickettsia salmonis]QGP51457.1 Putative transposase [Piscirickettsia salmonis]QGP52259.1 Putative transposase [Piscirickettsia salmonis]QGP52267.1 Putative transposase [Piscirickettsia salmonis]